MRIGTGDVVRAGAVDAIRVDEARAGGGREIALHADDVEKRMRAPVA